MVNVEVKKEEMHTFLVLKDIWIHTDHLPSHIVDIETGNAQEPIVLIFIEIYWHQLHVLKMMSISVHPVIKKNASTIPKWFVYLLIVYDEV